MNLPNKITCVRFFMVPVFIAAFLLGFDTAALVIFLLASVSDFFDGYLARKNNLITDFGKLMDPLADKLLTTSALVCFIATRDNFPCWCAIVVMLREFIITGLRQLAVEKNVIIQASYWGKTKTVFLMVTSVLFFLDWGNIYGWTWFLYFQAFGVYSSTALALISLFDYIKKNWKVIQLASK